MSLLELAETEPSAFEAYSVQQILAICGDGNLLDGSECSKQFRRYISLQSGSKLAEYANYCLDNSFPKSGAVLQDIVNEIGQRLGYNVTHGRYTGSSREVGFDGLWQERDGALIVEVKTTDAYRINLDTVIQYASRTTAQGLTQSEPNVLLVVGRQDTGDLEAQVRGSRHAWQVRLVSVESLIRLMSVRGQISEETYLGKVRRILLPFEYTRVDHIINLVFETQREVEEKIVDLGEGASSNESDIAASSGWNFTPTRELDAKRDALLKIFYATHGGQYRRVTRAQYLCDQNGVRVACSISKRYGRDYQPYWYAFHPSWLEFLDQGKQGYFLLGCMDRDEGFAIPLDILKRNLEKLYKTEKEGRYYWHVALSEGDDGLFLNIPKTGERLYLNKFSFS